MFLTYEELFEISDMKESRVIAGRNGLYRLITWYSIIELANLETTTYEERLVFMTGIGINNMEDDLMRAVKTVCEEGAAGMVFEVGPYINQIPEAVIRYVEENDFPIISLPFKQNVGQLTYKMAKRIFDNTNKHDGMSQALDALMGDYLTEELFQKFLFYGYNPKRQYFALVMQPDGPDEGGESDKLYKIFHGVMMELNRRGYKDLLFTIQNSVIMLILPAMHGQNLKDEVTSLIEATRTGKYFVRYGYCFSVGVGNLFSDLAHLKKSLDEAADSLHMIHRCRKCGEVRVYEDTGVYRLFFEYNNYEELTSIYQDILGEILEYDRANGTELTQTLEVYLDSGCNIGTTAETMELHRNTVKYRIKRIREILMLEFTDVNRCFNLRLAYKIKKYLEL